MHIHLWETPGSLVKKILWKQVETREEIIYLLEDRTMKSHICEGHACFNWVLLNSVEPYGREMSEKAGKFE